MTIDTNFIDPRMINLDLMAKANIGLTYINTPSGFFNRMVTLYNNEKKQIDVNCQIKHLSNNNIEINKINIIGIDDNLDKNKQVKEN